MNQINELEKFVSKYFFFALIFMVLNLTQAVHAQPYSGLIKWERYKVTEHGVSLVFPKMPILIRSTDPCEDIEEKTYAAYAEEIVYTLVVKSRRKGKRPRHCDPGSGFGDKEFSNRIKELRRSTLAGQQSQFLKNGRKGTKFVGEMTQFWVVDDMKDNQWIELWITHRSDVSPDEKRFVESLEMSKSLTGIEINVGAEQTIGDSPTQIDVNLPSTNSIGEIKPNSSHKHFVVLTPKASYTELARQNSYQGTVQLRVTFLATGGIGKVTPITHLPYGLTEQAIYAAKRIVFIPKKVEGVNVSIIQPVEYSFSLY